MATATASPYSVRHLESSSSAPRLPALDGWRGVAILLVLFDHFQSAFLGRSLESWTQTGQHGVTIFFVLSGFLITSKLIENPARLRSFYIRRLFRLMPAAWTYLGFLLMFDVVFRHRVLSIREAGSCIFFYRNYVGDTGSMVASHFWSLSMEEQFYLVWPVLLALLGVRKVRWFAAGAALACAAYRFHNWGHYNRLWWNYLTQVRADAILVGCFLALLLASPTFHALAVRWSHRTVLPALIVLIFCIIRFPLLPPLFEDIAIATLICSSMHNGRGYLSRSLSIPVLAWLGIVSYSVYIWQQFFMGLHGTIGMCLLIIGLPFCALSSYYCIELPCVRIGHRLTRAMPLKKTADVGI